MEPGAGAISQMAIAPVPVQNFKLSSGSWFLIWAPAPQPWKLPKRTVAGRWNSRYARVCSNRGSCWRVRRNEPDLGQRRRCWKMRVLRRSESGEKYCSLLSQFGLASAQRQWRQVCMINCKLSSS